jgi:replicative DNA helicase
MKEEKASGLKFLAALLTDTTAQFIERGDLTHLFRESTAELKVYEEMRAHVTKYGALPQPDTLLEQTQTPLLEATEPTDYYHDMCVKRLLQRELVSGAEQIDPILRPPGGIGIPDPVKAYELMRDRMLRLQLDLKGAQLMDFRTAKDMVWSLYMQAIKGTNKGSVELGWPYLDSSDMGSGLFGGDVVSFVGRPQKGKTWMMLWCALHNWARGRTPLFISMEMDMQLIMLRLAGLYTHTEAKKIKGGNLSPTLLPGQTGVSEAQQLLEGHYEQQGGNKVFVPGLNNLGGHDNPLWVLDGNLASTVSEIRTYTAQLKPDVVLVDGAYLLSHEDKRLTMYQRVAANCELLKCNLAASLRLPVVASFQFNRVADKKLKKQQDEKNKGKQEFEIGLEDIAHSDAIGQISSIVLGFFEEATPESLVRKRIDVMKGRSGEQGVFYCNWDFNRMNFSQIAEEGTEHDPYSYNPDEQPSEAPVVDEGMPFK